MAKKNMKRCSTWLVITVRQSKTTMSYLYTPARMANIKMIPKARMEGSYIVRKNAKWYSHAFDSVL